MEEKRSGLAPWAIASIVVGGLALALLAGGLAGGVAGHFVGRRQAREVAHGALRDAAPRALAEALPRILGEQREEGPVREFLEKPPQVLRQPFSGALVRRVVGDSPAEKAGLRFGDLIVAVNERAVDVENSLAEVLDSFKAGDKITLTVKRDSQELKLEMTLGSKDGKPYLGIYYTMLPVPPLQPR